MAIYDIFNTEKNAPKVEEAPSSQDGYSAKDRFFSSLCARLFFFLLFLADIGWFLFSVCRIVFWISLHFLFLCRASGLRMKILKSWLSLKRGLVCGLSLAVSFCSPAFGIMIACTYFLMYDQQGIDEVVPASLKEQFKDLFAQSGQMT